MSSNALDELKRELEETKRREMALAQAIALLEGTAILVAPAAGELPQSDFRDLGIVDAAKRFILEAREPRTTREIADELQKRGVATTAKNWIATVYATLDNSPVFHRVGTGRRGRWELKEKR